MFEIELSKQSEKFYLSATDKLVSKINLAFDELSINPFYGNNIKKLKGKLDGLYRYRITDYRGCLIILKIFQNCHSRANGNP